MHVSLFDIEEEVSKHNQWINVDLMEDRELRWLNYWSWSWNWNWLLDYWLRLRYHWSNHRHWNWLSRYYRSYRCYHWLYRFLVINRWCF